ncbi:MAG: DUF3106 domain-containing protein, partial [Candidatus Acidiferrales bacterium]
VASLPPEEQEQALEADEFYQQLPPRAQENFRRRLAEFNTLPPEERQRRLEHGPPSGGRRMRDAAPGEPPPFDARQREPGKRAEELFLRVAPMAPEEQEQALAADEFFQQAPPEMQQRFRHRLQKFNALPAEERQQRLQHLRRFAELPPEERRAIRERGRIFAEMSPEQRQEAQRLFAAWQQLPPERRQLVAERLRKLHQAAPEERRRLAQDPEFLSPLRENERGLLRGLFQMRQNLPARPGQRQRQRRGPGESGARQPHPRP